MLYVSSHGPQSYIDIETERKGETRDIYLKAQTSVLVLYFPQTHDLLKDSALSATVASHLKQTHDRLSEEGKLFKGIVWI